MNDKKNNQMHVDLGFAFDKYVVSHLDRPLLHQLPQEAHLVFQTDDPEFNQWSLDFAERCRLRDQVEDRPMAVIQIHGAIEPRSSIDWQNAELLVKATA